MLKRFVGELTEPLPMHKLGCGPCTCCGTIVARS